MSGFFGVTSKKDCVFDLFYGTDYHSHLGTRRGGMAVYGKSGFERAIHNIENAPFRTKFERDFDEMEGNYGIGCISDSEPQPLLVRSHLGNYAITTVGRINNLDELVQQAFRDGASHFLEMSGGNINATELVAALINRGSTIAEGMRLAQEAIDGSMSILVLTQEGIYEDIVVEVNADGDIVASAMMKGVKVNFTFVGTTSADGKVTVACGSGAIQLLRKQVEIRIPVEYS